MNESALKSIIGNKLISVKSIETVDKQAIDEVLLDVASICEIKEPSFDFTIKKDKGYS